MELKLTDENFEAEVIKSKMPVLVDFYADWCGPCKMIEPIIRQLAEEYGEKIKIGKLNVDENPQTTFKYGIMSIPAIIIFKEGKEFKRQAGSFEKKEYQKLLKEVISGG